MRKTTKISIIVCFIGVSLNVNANLFNTWKSIEQGVSNSIKQTKTGGEAIGSAVNKKIISPVKNVVSGAKNTIKTIEDALKYYDILNDASAEGYRSSGGHKFQQPSFFAESDGELKIAIFNVKGFPVKLNGISNETAGRISTQIINDSGWDIIGLQENWVRNNAIMSKINKTKYPYLSDHFQGNASTFGDGLSLISKYPFAARQEHVKYNKCHGTYLMLVANLTSSPDCETEKGFTFARVYLANDLFIDVYNTHMDTAQGAVKQSQFNQLEAFIASKSQGNPVIVMGDFNSWIDNNQAQGGASAGGTFASNLGLTWACDIAGPTYSNKEKKCSGVDHLAFRGNNQFSFRVENEKEVKQTISDHHPLVTTLRWTNHAAR
ncbi:endonuclease/exonuclease/phosphatase family protein [uncultured Shewanella sp.]|uniref:endonuclease/exonuclease/phosphatase family protein n=1 Tax=uncultured Shewanella sp. TaxID=173975 RepID=UPI00262CE3E8|nr:endonuclease/exonuclease/phosphatase family protein [uncultured Shewanella sp.]